MHVSRRLVGTAADFVRQWSRWGAVNAGVDNAASSNIRGVISTSSKLLVRERELRGSEAFFMYESMIFYQRRCRIIASYASAGVAIAEISVRLSVRPSVCPSRSDIVLKETKILH